jgi:tol-pal system protein YbgF
MSARAIALLATVTLLLGGCASGGPSLLRRDDSSAQEVERLKQHIVELQRQVRVNEVELGRLRDRIQLLEGSGRAVRSTAPGSRRATPPAVSEPTTEPIAPPRYVPPPDEEPPRRPADRSRETAGIEESNLKLPPSAAERTAGSSPPPPADVVVGSAEDSLELAEPPTASGPAEAAPAVVITPAAQALYDQGYSLHNQGRYVDAEATFRRFLQSYPNTALSDNAQYWIGEARLARGDHRGALSAFFETVERYPEGNKVPDALLKAARSLQATGDLGGARMTYDELVRRFPNTAAAAVAEEERSALP